MPLSENNPPWGAEYLLIRKYQASAMHVACIKSYLISYLLVDGASAVHMLPAFEMLCEHAICQGHMLHSR